ncbi:NEAT domain-containing protein [Paenibacillus polymyxa]|uniref:NEAT domain-containing protein n=1 Tax=Paenibacillus polymyxa TaxID=1406 RepID=UPI000F88D4F7|nr:NEAT domain-containing protein [Paenibacillus polymyxa]KAE8560535.1 iron transporter [Paenibacillus polymyxa]MCJ1220587.1 NEAT domain-containing protein [Paenibacillus polymyxa]QDA27696.1 iron transporter [Paenibacillus polymyxa]RTZ32996.1 iron transporter [Paenibacillus polymyxa]
MKSRLNKYITTFAAILMLFSLFSPYAGATPEDESTSSNLPDSSTTVTSATYATYEYPVELPGPYVEPTNAITTTEATYADGEYLIDYKPLRKTVSGSTKDSSFKTNYTYPGDLIIKDGKYHFSFKFAEAQGLSKFLVEQNGETVPAKIEVDSGKASGTVSFDVYDFHQNVNTEFGFNSSSPWYVDTDPDRSVKEWIEFDPSSLRLKNSTENPTVPPVTPPVTPPGTGEKLTDLDFTLLKDGTEEKSMMDGYTEKPGSLIERGGKQYAQFTLKNSKQIDGFKVEQNGVLTDTSIVSEDQNANTRVIEFEVKELPAKLNAWVSINWPELGYVHTYNVDLQLASVPVPTTLADGTYAINFNTLHATKDQPSTMAQYLLSPATLTVAKGQKEVSFTIKDSTTVTEFKTEQNGTLTDADIVSEDKTANTRVVKFKVADLDAILNAQVHVSTTYPGGVYEMDHKLRLQFDKNSITENGSSPETTSNLDFTLLKDGTNEVSMMDGYTGKPGTLIERNGKKYLRFTLKNSKQIDGFKVEQNGVLTNVATVSEDKTANTRVIEFEVKEIPAKLSAWVSINWPELGYVHTYNVDLQLASAPTSPSLADGTYAINFNTLHATKDQPSAMAQYLLSPATLTVAKGQKEVSFTIKDSTTVTEFKTEQNGTLTDADIVSEDKTANTRVVKFKVADLDAILNAQVHVSTTYPGGVYEMDHKLRLQFDKNSITNAPTPVDPGTPGTPGTPGKNLADGTYSINFDALHATKDQKSAMAQYLLSPATLTVSKGKYEASFTIKDSTTVTEFKTEQNGTLTDADIVSEDKNANTRVVKFKVANLDAILNAQVHVSTTYPGGVYEMDHKLRLQFDRSSVTAKGPDNGTTTPVENGRYSIDFSVLKNGSNEISVMDGYMQKPATLLKQSGKNIIQIKMDKSSWIKTFKVNGSEAQVVEQSTSADTRTVQFEVPNLSDKVTVNTHVIVPGLDLGGIPYDHVYDVQFQFEPATIRSFVEPTSSGAADPIVKLDFDKLANGKYALKFTIVLPDGITGSESPAQRFITNEPAQLVVEGDKRFVGLKLQNSNEVKALRIWDNASGGYQDAEVTREDAASNTKDVRFSVSDFKNNVKGQLVVYEAPKVASSAPMVFKAEDRVEKVYDFEFKFDTSNVSYHNETKADEVEQGKNNLADGEYTANFRVLANGTDKDSLVAPFVQSLAKLIVKNGKVQAHVTVTDNQALKLFQTDFEGRYANPTIVGTDTKGDTHTIAFEVPDLDKKLSVYTQVYLPEKYIFNEKFGGQIQFDRASLKGEGVNVATTATATESAAASTDKATETTTSVAEAKPAVEQPVQPASEKQYTINYNVFKDKTNEASVMDGYLDKPATLIEKGDKRYIQITLKNSSWMPTLQVEQNGTLKDVEVISTSGDTRIVQFEVGDLSQKISAYTHVIVPGLVLGGVPYDHWYTVQFQFDEASLKVK